MLRPALARHNGGDSMRWGAGTVDASKSSPPGETANTIAGQQTTGPARLTGALLALALIALLLSWHLPLFHTEFLVFLENDVTLIGAVQTLWETDLFLCAVVVIFGIAAPFLKLVALLYAWYALPLPRARGWIARISKLSKFSMLDVLLIAVVIVGLKGIGKGKVTVAYGLYVYAGVVIAVLILSSLMLAVAAGSDDSGRP